MERCEPEAVLSAPPFNKLARTGLKDPYQGPPRKGCMISPLTAQGVACWRLRGAAGLGEDSAVMPEQIGA